MFTAKAAFSGFSVDDLAKSKTFYTEILRLKVTSDEMGLHLELPGSSKVFVYQKDDHKPATYTVLNLVVDNIDAAVSDLAEKGVEFKHYSGMPQDDKGVLRGLSSNLGPDIAWFEDPAGNVFSILQEA